MSQYVMGPCPEPKDFCQLQVKFKKINPDAKIPTRNHKNDAGLDIYAIDGAIIGPNQYAIFPTGIQSEIPEGYCMLLFDRSSMGSRGFGRLAGVIDSGYRGEWKVILANHSREIKTVRDGDKIIQGILTKLIDYDIVEVTELSDSDRGQKGFGSSGS